MGQAALAAAEAVRSEVRTVTAARRLASNSRRWTTLVLACLTVLYILLIADRMSRPLWFDELFTYYIAQAPDLRSLFDALTHTDFNPPLVYLLVRGSHAVFGDSEFATRLPGACVFYFGSMAAWFFAKRRVGVWWAASGILLFWSTPYITLATEARPYGLLVGFFGLALVAYDESGSRQRRRWAVPALAAGSTGMMLSHVFAPLTIVAFCAAEAVRWRNRRRFDPGVWAALLVPVLMELLYIPAARNFGKILFPADYQASGLQIANFFERLSFFYIVQWLTIAVVLAMAAMPYTRTGAGRWFRDRSEAAWYAVLMMAPAALNLALARTGGAFWERYCVTTALAFYVFMAIALARLTGYRKSSAVVASLVLCAGALSKDFEPDSQAPLHAPLIAAVGPRLPIVAASGLTFLEMDRYEPELRPRLCYLVDRAAAETYAHSTIFENLPLLTRYFPIRSHVGDYSGFVAKHPDFLVLTRADYLEVWVIQKLWSEGARVRFVKTIPGARRDYQLYQVHAGL